jgi:hypothetical protein
VARAGHTTWMTEGKARPFSMAAFAWAALFAGFIAAVARGDDEASWHDIYREHGIVVSTQDDTGQKLPSFRGRAKLHGSVLHVLAVVLDGSRSKEWAKNVSESSVLHFIDARTQVVYSRSRQVWPVSDRDLVMKRSVEILKPRHEYRVRLSCIRGDKPALPHVIRIVDCETVFTLREIDPSTTFVEFRVRADPGGNYPAWIVRWAQKNIPFDTLTGLGRQLDKTRHTYAPAIAQWQKAE